MKSALTLAASILVSSMAHAFPAMDQLPELKTGDIVFQESTSHQANAIMMSTGSDYSHVGVVEVKGKSIRVWEAVNPVRVISFQQWMNKGKNDKLLILRMKNELSVAQQNMIVSGAAKYNNRAYDPFFSSDNKEIYCSELVDLAYKAAGLTVGHYEPIDKFVRRSPLARELLRTRGQGHPLCRGKGYPQAKCEELIRASTLITPASIENDRQLKQIYPVRRGILNGLFN